MTSQTSGFIRDGEDRWGKEPSTSLKSPVVAVEAHPPGETNTRVQSGYREELFIYLLIVKDKLYGLKAEGENDPVCNTAV